MHVQLNAFLHQNSRRFSTRKYTKITYCNHATITAFYLKNTVFISKNDAIKLFFGQNHAYAFFKIRCFFTTFLRSSTLQIYAVLRLFRLSFLYILFLTFIKGFLIKVHTFRVLCGTKSIDYIKNDRALCAPSPIFLQLTIRFRPVVFYFSSMPNRHLFLCFYRKQQYFLSLFDAEKQSFSPSFSTQKRKRFTPFQSAKKVGFPYTNTLI